MNSKTKIRQIVTIGDLRKFLVESDQSPEIFSSQIPISNMTLRRLLELGDQETVPEKYFAVINAPIRYEAAPAIKLAPVALVTSGFEKTQNEIIADLRLAAGATVESATGVATLKKDLKNRRKILGVPPLLVKGVSKLKGFVEDSKNPAIRHVAVGALLYFLNPFDLVADSIIGIGLIDDLGIITIALNKIIRGLK